MLSLRNIWFVQERRRSPEVFMFFLIPMVNHTVTSPQHRILLFNRASCNGMVFLSDFVLIFGPCQLPAKSGPSVGAFLEKL